MKHLIILLVLGFVWQAANAQIAPDFTITDSDGEVHNLYSDYLDSNKIVVIKMFFVACPLCKPYNEPFQAMYEAFGEGEEDVEFLLLTTKNWDSNEDVRNYRIEYGLTFPGSGNDGGGYDATGPYRNGDFGTFFGSPTFLVIEPNRTVHFDLAASGVEATLEKVRAKIIEVQNDSTSNSASTVVTVNVEDYKGGTPPDYKIMLRSSVNPDSVYEVATTFQYPSDVLPVLSEPEVFLEIEEMNSSGITTIDLVLVQRFILSIQPLDNIQRLAADVNGSGTLTPSDLLSMRKVILTIQDGFDVGSFLAVNGECMTDADQCDEKVKVDATLSTQQINFSVIKYGDMK